MRDSLLNYLPFHEREDGSITRELHVDKNTFVSLDGFPARIFAGKRKGLDCEIREGTLTYNFKVPKQKNVLGRVFISHNGVKVQLWNQTHTSEYPIGWNTADEAYTWSNIRDYVSWRNKMYQVE